MKFLKYTFVTLLILSFTNPINADWHSDRPDGHAPIGVMADHTHKKGEWMLSLRSMTMKMNGNRSGTSETSAANVLTRFMVSPVEMTTTMHMLGVMWSPAKVVTLMAMVPHVKKTMDHVTRAGGSFTTEADGVGDIGLSALIPLAHFGRQMVFLNAGLRFPTGSIDEKDRTPMGPNQQLPYPMQLGSGTYDLQPGVTYLGQANRLSWGAQLSGTLRLGENDRDYALGDVFESTAWGALKLASWISGSVRVRGRSWGDIDGRDTQLNPAVVPTAVPNFRAGDRIDGLLGINLFGTGSFVKGHRLAVEVGVPIYQRLDGPQLESDLVTTLGWQKAF